MNKFINILFPTPVSNTFPGYKVALFVFVLITVMTIVRSGIHIIAPDGGAQSIASIPLNTFSEAASSAIVLIFSLWGLAQLLMGIIYVVVFIKYKSLIPFMYVLIIVEYSVRIILGFFKPIETLSTAPGEIGNFILIPLSILMFILCFKFPKNA